MMGIATLFTKTQKDRESKEQQRPVDFQLIWISVNELIKLNFPTNFVNSVFSGVNRYDEIYAILSRLF